MLSPSGVDRMGQVQFLLTLENISNRLLVVPRPARVSALRAELTALNHKLPAEVNLLLDAFPAPAYLSPRYACQCGAVHLTPLANTMPPHSLTTE